MSINYNKVKAINKKFEGNNIMYIIAGPIFQLIEYLQFLIAPYSLTTSNYKCHQIL